MFVHKSSAGSHFLVTDVNFAFRKVDFFDGRLESDFRAIGKVQEELGTFKVGFIPDFAGRDLAVPPGEHRLVFSIRGSVDREIDVGTEIQLFLTDGGGEGFGVVELRNELVSGGRVRLLESVSGSIRIGQVILRGDSDHDGRVNVTDAVRILNYLFAGGEEPPCPDEADANDDGVLNISDASAILGALFRGLQTIAPPFPVAGPDPTEDDLTECTRG